MTKNIKMHFSNVYDDKIMLNYGISVINLYLPWCDLNMPINNKNGY